MHSWISYFLLAASWSSGPPDRRHRSTLPRKGHQSLHVSQAFHESWRGEAFASICVSLGACMSVEMPALCVAELLMWLMLDVMGCNDSSSVSSALLMWSWLHVGCLEPASPALFPCPFVARSLGRRAFILALPVTTLLRGPGCRGRGASAPGARWPSGPGAQSYRGLRRVFFFPSSQRLPLCALPPEPRPLCALLEEPGIVRTGSLMLATALCRIETA